MLTYETKVTQVLRRLLNEAVATATENVIQGHCEPEAYKHLCGRISAFNETQDLIDQAFAIVEGKDSETDGK